MVTTTFEIADRHAQQVRGRTFDQVRSMVGWAAVGIMPTAGDREAAVPGIRPVREPITYCLTRSWTTGPSGRRTLAAVFRGYKVDVLLDADGRGTAALGGEGEFVSVSAHDIRYAPVAKAAPGGKILDIQATAKWSLALDMDAAVEAAVQGRLGVAPERSAGPPACSVVWVDRVRWPHLLVGFRPADVPSPADTPEARAVALEVARTGLLPPWPECARGRTRVPSLVRSPGGRVVGVIDDTDDAGRPVVVIGFATGVSPDADLAVTLPAGAVPVPECRSGVWFEEGARFAHFPPPHRYGSWADVVGHLGADGAAALLAGVIADLDEPGVDPDTGEEVVYRRAEFLPPGAVPAWGTAPMAIDYRHLLHRTVVSVDTTSVCDDGVRRPVHTSKEVWTPIIQVVRGDGMELVGHRTNVRYDLLRYRPDWRAKFNRDRDDHPGSTPAQDPAVSPTGRIPSARWAVMTAAERTAVVRARAEAAKGQKQEEEGNTPPPPTPAPPPPPPPPPPAPSARPTPIVTTPEGRDPRFSAEVHTSVGSAQENLADGFYRMAETDQSMTLDSISVPWIVWGRRG